MVKMTFTLDEPTVAALRKSAARLSKPRSEIVRLAIRDYADRVGKLSEPERLKLLRIFDEMLPHIPMRPAAAVDREIEAVRRARRAGGRRSASRL